MVMVNGESQSGWGKDSLSEFIEEANHNTHAAFVNLKPQFDSLRNIHDAFKQITNNLNNPPYLLPAFFLFRSHASYLGAVRLAISGQISETYMVLRGCLENSLYALYISRKPETGEIWLKRQDDESSLKECKKCFLIGNIFETLDKENEKLGRSAKRLYDMTIDYGAHPNELSLSSIMKKKESDNEVSFNIAYLTNYLINPLAFGLCLKNTARIGVCSLIIFRSIFPERFDILGLSEKVNKLKRGL